MRISLNALRAEIPSLASSPNAATSFVLQSGVEAIAQLEAEGLMLQQQLQTLRRANHLLRQHHSSQAR